jgi:hypothetical protein
MLVFYQLIGNLDDWPKERVEAMVFGPQTARIKIIPRLNKILVISGSVFAVRAPAIWT